MKNPTSDNVVWHHATVTRERREKLNGHKSCGKGEKGSVPFFGPFCDKFVISNFPTWSRRG